MLLPKIVDISGPQAPRAKLHLILNFHDQFPTIQFTQPLLCLCAKDAKISSIKGPKIFMYASYASPKLRRFMIARSLFQATSLLQGQCGWGPTSARLPYKATVFHPYFVREPVRIPVHSCSPLAFASAPRSVLYRSSNPSVFEIYAILKWIGSRLNRSGTLIFQLCKRYGVEIRRFCCLGC